MATPDSQTRSTTRTDVRFDSGDRPSGGELVCRGRPATAGSSATSGRAMLTAAASRDEVGVATAELAACGHGCSVIDRHVCSAVTAGIVNISDRPMAATT